MIVGFGGGGLGIRRSQTAALQELLKLLPITEAVHRGMTGIETMIHSHVRAAYPRIPVHIVPILGVYSALTFKPEPPIIVYPACTPDVANSAIVQTVWGIVFLPEYMTKGGPGWDLPYEAERQGVPVLFIWPNGETKTASRLP